MTDAPSFFDELQDLVLEARRNGVEPQRITLGAVKTLAWERACAEYQYSINAYDPNPQRSFCGIPVVVNSETPGISVG